MQETRAESELLEVGMHGEKCDMGIFKLVTTDIAEKKAYEVIFFGIDTQTS